MKVILVVEDNADIREYVALFLRRAGYDVLEAENGRHALEQLEVLESPPSLLLIDTMMPVMGGPALLQAISEHRRLADIPVIVVSANDRPPQIPDAVKFIRKSDAPDLLLAAIHELCGPP